VKHVRIDQEGRAVSGTLDGDRIRAEAHTGTDLMFSFAYQIADVARLIILEPGDVRLTGTPANSRPVEPGDVVAVEVEGIGWLENRVVQSEEALAPIGEQRAEALAPMGEQPAVTAQTLHVALTIPEEEAEQKWRR
jgi:5-oxopent-3-ene-1,2,5-tricarboxylate decarboxylase/2-hydroxyhepta-2,4-diene-1,7-dioate isomerase